MSEMLNSVLQKEVSYNPSQMICRVRAVDGLRTVLSTECFWRVQKGVKTE